MRCAIAACLLLSPLPAAGTCLDCIDYGTDPVEPIVGTLDVTDSPVDVQVRGDLVYLLTNDRYSPEDPPVHELVIASAADPTAPVQLGALDSPWGHVDLDVDGGFAYVADPSLAKIDVSDPTSPQLVGYYDFGGFPGETAKRLDVDGDYAYVITELEGAGEEYIRVFDVSGDVPSPLGRVEFSSPVVELVGRGSYLYAVGHSGFFVLDVSDPEHPEVVTQVSLEYHGTDIGLLGDVAVVCVLERPSVIFDISEPTSPTLITQGPGLAGFEVAADLLYCRHASGIRVLDLSDPANPAVVGIATELYAFSFDVDGCHVATVNPFLGDELRMVPVHCSKDPASIPPDPFPGDSGPELARTVPNPAREGVTIHLDFAAEGGAVDLRIHDAAGRLVRRILDPALGSSIAWDGRDESGMRVRPGLYFYRVESAAGPVHGRVTILD